MFRAAVISLFPEMFSAITENGVTGRALTRGLAEIKCFNPRDFASDKHRTVDDRPYGGGPGMVMKIEPLSLALAQARVWLSESRQNSQKPADDTWLAAEGAEHSHLEDDVKVIYLSPQGRRLDRAGVAALGQSDNLILVAGRYEGIDERFIENEVDEEVSIGDYVLSGGELPAMVLLDALLRRLPDALGDGQSAEQDSFENGLLDCPHYTRPEMLSGHSVPEVLLSGDHKKIDAWRHQQALGRTSERRPDLLEKIELSDAQKKLLNEYQHERK